MEEILTGIILKNVIENLMFFIGLATLLSTYCILFQFLDIVICNILTFKKISISLKLKRIFKTKFKGQ